MAFRPLHLAFGALLAPLPLTIYNPDFARGGLEWLELLGGSVAIVFAACAVGAGIARLARRPAGSGAHLGGWIAVAGLLLGVGWVVGGLGGMIAVLVAAGVAFTLPRLVAVLKRRISGPATLLFATSIATALLAAVGSVGGRPDPPERQLVMIGYDGTTWDLVDRFRAAGMLPNFDRLIRTGASAELQTLHPILSPPIWASIGTGKSPDAHGIKDFWATSHDLKAKWVWDIADEAGLSTGVLGYLVTWPPYKKGGFLVPGWMAQGTETIPPELSFLKELERGEKAEVDRSPLETLGLVVASLRHGVTLGTLNESVGAVLARRLGKRDDRQRAAENRRLKLAFNSDVYCHLLRRHQPDFSIFYDSGIDATEHLFFKYFEPESFPSVKPEEVAALGDAIPEIYRRADAAIGRIVASARPGANFLIVSDHGQEAARTRGERWYAIRTTRLIEELGIGELVVATNIAGSVYLRAKDENADLAPVWEAFGQLATQDGRPLFELEQTSPTEASIVARDGYDLETEPAVVFRGREIAAKTLLRNSEQISGRHTETAFFLLNGPDIQEGKKLPRGSVLDVTPTVLALLGLPVARDMEGAVLAEAFRPELLRRQPLRWVESHGEPVWSGQGEGDTTLDEEALERLRSLGYVQ